MRITSSLPSRNPHHFEERSSPSTSFVLITTVTMQSAIATERSSLHAARRGPYSFASNNCNRSNRSNLTTTRKNGASRNCKPAHTATKGKPEHASLLSPPSFAHNGLKKSTMANVNKCSKSAHACVSAKRTPNLNYMNAYIDSCLGKDTVSKTLESNNNINSSNSNKPAHAALKGKPDHFQKQGSPNFRRNRNAKKKNDHSSKRHAQANICGKPEHVRCKCAPSFAHRYVAQGYRPARASVRRKPEHAGCRGAPCFAQKQRSATMEAC